MSHICPLLSIYTLQPKSKSSSFLCLLSTTTCKYPPSLLLSSYKLSKMKKFKLYCQLSYHMTDLSKTFQWILQKNRMKFKFSSQLTYSFTSDSHFSFTIYFPYFLLFTMLQSYGPSLFSLNTPIWSLPLNICTTCFLCLKVSSWYSQG